MIGIYIEVYNTETEFSLKRREGGSEAASEVEQQMMGTTASVSGRQCVMVCHTVGKYFSSWL